VGRRQSGRPILAWIEGSCSGIEVGESETPRSRDDDVAIDR